ncbi:MAG: hypothetical protein U0840_18715 [Gemmataceae bacterium]
MSSSRKMLRADPRLEALEDRTAPSVSSIGWNPSTRTLTAWCNNNPSNISIATYGSNYRLTDSTNGAVVNFSGNASRVQVVGGAANDRVVQYVPNLRLEPGAEPATTTWKATTPRTTSQAGPVTTGWSATAATTSCWGNLATTCCSAWWATIS